MTDVILTLRVMPTSVDVNLDELEKKLTELVKPQKIVREPIAFGLVALMVTKIVPDAGDELEKLESLIKTLNEVQGTEVVEITRSL